MEDMILFNGLIYDGTDNPPFKADITIKDGIISGVGQFKGMSARRSIDLKGLSISPGFIDTHTHSDIVLLQDGSHLNSVMQGVTTVLIGQDGLGYAPLSNENLEMFANYLSGLNGPLNGLKFKSNSFKEYLDEYDKKTAINVGSLVTHSAIRLQIAGFNNVKLDRKELLEAERILCKSFEEEALGLSTGLSYFPCTYSDNEELLELCKITAKYDLPFVVHLRTVFDGPPFNPILEAIEIAKMTGVKVHISHYRTNNPWAGYGEIYKLLHPIDKAIEEGADISAETYPYNVGSSHIVMFLPPWAVEGGYYKTLERLKNPKEREKIKDHLRNMNDLGEHYFSHLKNNTEFIGKNFNDCARKMDISLEDLMCEILLDEKLEAGYIETPNNDENLKKRFEDDLLELMKKPYYMVGSDSIPAAAMPHPRTFGTFPKFIRLAIDNGFPLEKMINRMTLVPAKRFNIENRGEIKKGNIADLTVFDPEQILSTASYEEPKKYAKGIEYVIVNGEEIMSKGKATGIFSGQVIR